MFSLWWCCLIFPYQIPLYLLPLPRVSLYCSSPFFLLPSFVLDVFSHPWSKTCLVIFDLLPYKSPSLLLVVFPTVVADCWVTALNPDGHEENMRWFNKPLQKNLWGNKKGSISLKLLQVLFSTVVVWLALRLVKGQLPPRSGFSSSPSLLCYRS